MKKYVKCNANQKNIDFSSYETTGINLMELKFQNTNAKFDYLPFANTPPSEYPKCAFLPVKYPLF